MAALFTTVSGCCAARYWYDFGYAHGRTRAKDIGEFHDWFAGKLATINFGVTNSEQDKERKWLEELGWHSAPQQGSGLIVHSISASHFRNHNAERIAEFKRKKAEEETKKREEELRRRQELQAQRREAEKKIGVDRETIEGRIKYIKHIKKITPEDIRFFSPSFLNETGAWDRFIRHRREVVLDILRRLQVHHSIWTVYENSDHFWSDRRTRSALCQRINTQLKKQK